MASTRQRKAQSAFATRDSELSRAVHQSRELAEIAAGKSDFLHGVPPSNSFSSSSSSSFLMGSVISCVIAAVASAGAPSPILVWALALVVVSLVLYISSWIDERFRSDFTEFEKSRERWEVENFPEGEIQEMIHIYTEYGISEEDAESVAKTLSKYPDFWIDHMLLHEIGILPPAVQRGLDDAPPSSQFIPILSLIAAFLVPTALVTLGLSTIATIAANCQVCILLYIKSAKCQWLSLATSVGICVTTVLSTLIIHLVTKTILSLV